ncbi:bacillithiol system redox-active protein YtxJ [Sulfoacidibacillus thermotolerans]|uniref:General stress protein n=1 Tax=Sulfoacidibacillus thermotolerans TaxID=1765684 RepID=A0A2U3DC23_SULT2|nr:bacillithiol system redox-active protein YtxJ [Sulfoacidibacillus thermotolerans]PWI58830.1 hypothetical protein BM613_01695 [Sulfoacidibacillus thermotolerans]
MIELKTEAEWIEQTSKQASPYFIFKHSTTCPISAAAYHEVMRFEQKGLLPIFMVKVREARPFSLKLADSLHVAHASPQVILVKENHVLWHTSHGSITEQSLVEAVSKYV